MCTHTCLHVYTLVSEHTCTPDCMLMHLCIYTHGYTHIETCTGMHVYTIRISIQMSAYMCIHMSIRISIRMSIHMSMHISIHVSAHMSMQMSPYMPVRMPVHTSVDMSGHKSRHTSVHMPMQTSIHMSYTCLRISIQVDIIVCTKLDFKKLFWLRIGGASWVRDGIWVAGFRSLRMSYRRQHRRGS